VEAILIIVSGKLYVEPDARDEYLAGCLDVIEQARAAPGCLDFVLASDPIEPDRINVYEQWESDAHLDRFRGAGPESDQVAAIRDAQVVKYRISSSEAP
jgi:quinol monooxygenase YgiN